MPHRPLSVSSCQTCKLRNKNSFCNLPGEALIALDRLKQTRCSAAGTRLFDEGEPVHEVLIVCQGSVALTFCSYGGNGAMLGLSAPGEVLGLSSAMSGGPHELSAYALENTQLAAIPRQAFLRLLERFPEAALNAGIDLSRKVNRAYEKIRLIGSGLSIRQRLAAWLLHAQEARVGKDLLITFTHERIAQMLGVSRESVTRAISDLRGRGVLDVNGIHFLIRDESYLRRLIETPEDRREQEIGCDTRHRQRRVVKSNLAKARTDS